MDGRITCLVTSFLVSCRSREKEKKTIYTNTVIVNACHQGGAGAVSVLLYKIPIMSILTSPGNYLRTSRPAILPMAHQQYTFQDPRLGKRPLPLSSIRILTRFVQRKMAETRGQMRTTTKQRPTTSGYSAQISTSGAKRATTSEV